MPVLHIFYALLVVMVWGGNFVASKMTLAELPPLLASALRLGLLCPLLLPFVPRPTLPQLSFLALLSITGAGHFALPQVSLAVGLDIATCAILNQLAVPFACVLGVFFHGDRIGKWRMLGLLLAFAGVVVVYGSPHLGSSWLGSAYAIAAAFCFAIYSVMLKRYPSLSAMQILAYTCLFAAPQLLALSFLLEAPTLDIFRNASAVAYGGMAYTVVFSTIVGHGLWNYLVQKHPISRVAPFALLIPITGVGFGQLFYAEPLTLPLLLGGVMTLLGVGIIVIRRPKLLEKNKGI